MIKEIHLQNFQSHYDSHLSFSEGVNVIVGNSDSGKTAIIRALRWICTNRPLGDSFRSTWGGETKVELFTDNAHITRKKGKENEYVLGKISLGVPDKGVPQEITQALNLSEINLQMQLDSPFLLSESPGNVASFWNKIAKLEKIDLGTSNINSTIRELTANIKYSEGQEKALIEGLKKFDHLQAFESNVLTLETLEKEQTELLNKRYELNTLSSKLEIINDRIEEQQEILALEEPVDNILALYQEKQALEIKRTDLWVAILQVKDINGDIEDWNKILALEQPVNNLLKLYEKKDKLQSDKNKLNSIITRAKSIQDEITKQNQVLNLETPVLALLKLYEERKTLIERKTRLSQAVLSVKDIQVRLITANVRFDVLHKEFEEAAGDTCFFCHQPIRKGTL